MSQELIIFALRIGILALLYVFLTQVAAIILKDIKAAGKSEAPPQRVDFLVVFDGKIDGLPPGEAIPLESANTLGRATSNSIVLLDDFASAQHAVLGYKQRAWWIEDLGSTNGTLVNGKPINKPTRVAVGDVIQIGTSKLRLGSR